jgi:predicted AAA+ superfamily ATPase
MSALLIGRAREKRVLEAALGSSEAELVAVYGRRRVGKTFLIRELFARKIVVEITGIHGASLRVQLHTFAHALAAASGAPLPLAPPADWHEAFRSLIAWLPARLRPEEKSVLFFDEVPWLASRRSGFLAAFEHFWNTWAVRRRDLVVVVCGSASAWMTQNLMRARGGLHNRVTRRIRLEPFDLGETEAYFASRRIELGRYHLLELYIALGGIPHYLRQVERGESSAQTVDRLCFAQEAPLRDEFRTLYASLFEHAERHEQVVRALASKRHGMTRNDVIAAARLSSGGSATKLLDELESSGFIMRTPQFGLPFKDSVYRLIDEFSSFHLAFIDRHRGRGDNVWLTKRGSPAWRAWSGYAFEGVCLKHVAAIKRALGIEAVETTESSWRHRPAEGESGAQIDLVIDRKDAAINLCEVKFSEAPFTIDKRYAAELRHKRDAFRRATATKKSLITTAITTFGLQDNAHSRELVDRSLDMAALFR